MTQKTSKKPSSAAISANNAPISDVKGQAFDLRDKRGGVSTTFDQAMERVWRNCLYPQQVQFREYYQMYARNNIAARVIETFPDYCWSAVPFVSDTGGGNSRFSKSVTDVLTTQYKLQDGVRQSLLTSMKQLDVLGGIGGEALLVFGFSDGRKISQPVKKSRNNKLMWVKILHNGQFEVEKTNEDETSPDYGDVLLYRSKDFTSSVDLNFASHIAPGVSIHESRCVHFKESNGLSYGTSRIQKCYNQLLDITKLAGASAEVYWLGAFSGLSIETDPTASLSDETYERMKVDTTKYFDGLARALVFEGATSKLLYPAIVSPKDHFDLQITMISIATGIPRRFLTGAEAAKLASQQDTLNWMERVTNRREMFVGPKVVSPVVQRCIDAGVIVDPREGTFVVSWPRSQSLALNERADAARNMAASWYQYFSSGMADLVSFDIFLLFVCGYSEGEAAEVASKTDWKKWKVVQKIAEKSNAPSSGTAKPDSGSTDKKAAALDARLTDIEAIIENMPVGVVLDPATLPTAPKNKRSGKDA